MPEKGVAEKAAIRRILREVVGEFAWMLKGENGPLSKHGYPSGVENPFKCTTPSLLNAAISVSVMFLISDM